MRIGLVSAGPRDRLTRLVLAGLTVAVVAWLGYAFGRAQSLATVARLYRDQDQLTFTVNAGQMVAQMARTGGDAKPVLKTADGAVLMDYADWDYSAAVVADGERFELVRLLPTTSVDYARNRLVEGLDSGSWILSREITLGGDQAEVVLSFLAKKPLHDVQVAIPHSAWYFMNVRPQETGFSAGVPRGTVQEVESGVVRTPSYEVRLDVNTKHPASGGLINPVRSSPYGVQTVLTQYTLNDPPEGSYVELAREQVTFRKL